MTTPNKINFPPPKLQIDFAFALKRFRAVYLQSALAETYARDPQFYSGTFCVACRAHFPVGADGEFTWDGTTEKVGT